MKAPYKVLLPKHIFDQANTKEELKNLILTYMKRYPEYTIIRVEKGYAICKRRDQL